MRKIYAWVHAILRRGYNGTSPFEGFPPALFSVDDSHGRDVKKGEEKWFRWVSRLDGVQG
jgi:hypothetical protein